MKTFLLIVVFLLIPLSAIAQPGNPLERQLVTVRVTSQAWNEYRPWQKKKPKTRRFIGTVLPGKRILMPADDLDDATLIQVEKFDRPPRVPAHVIHCDPQIGLAIITVDDPGFFDDLQPVDLATKADEDKDYCATWMSGQLSLAACRWSNVSVAHSEVPYGNFVKIYLITDLNKGGWGEPLFSSNKMVGITTAQAGNTILVLPAELVRAYLRAVDMPKYPGFAWLGLHYQTNKGLAQAAYYGQTGKPTGVRIRSCFPGSSADGILEADDILLELDGHKIDSLGDYVHPRYGTLNLNYIATENHYAGDVISARVLRNKKVITVKIPLKNVPPSAALIPEARISMPPPYLMAGGLVFRELDVPYLQAWGQKWKKKVPPYLRILYELKSEARREEQRHLILLSDVFPDEYNIGYHDLSQNIVKTVNGYPVDSIRTMEEAFKHPEDGFQVIEFMLFSGMNKVILDAKQFDQATKTIMEKYQIPSRIRTRP